MATWDSADDDPGETEEDDVNDNDVNDHDFNNGDATETRIQRNPQLYNNGSCSDSDEVLKHKISTMLELIGKTVSCILCRGSTLYFDETSFQKFYRHLQFEHSAMHDLVFMLDACKMTDNEKGALVTVFNKKVPDQWELQTASFTAATKDKSNSKKFPDAKEEPKEGVAKDHDVALKNNFTMMPRTTMMMPPQTMMMMPQTKMMIPQIMMMPRTMMMPWIMMMPRIMMMLRTRMKPKEKLILQMLRF